ncbi:TPA: HNH endonuclease [Streptococcus suis]
MLREDEVAHHVNGNKLDNRAENIELMSFSEHSRHHAKEKWKERGGFVAI